MLQLIGGTASAGITALALTPGRRVLAVAEAALDDKGCASVNLYDTSTLKRRKVLSSADLGSRTVVGVAFSGDGRVCLTQGGEPDWKLVLWTFDKVCDHSSRRYACAGSSDGLRYERSTDIHWQAKSSHRGLRYAEGSNQFGWSG